MTEIKLSGSCLCGAVKYELNGDPKRFYHCHCRRCRKATGTGHATNMMLTSIGINWISGEALLVNYKLPEADRFATCFCGRCGSLMPRHVEDLGIVVVPAGTLDTDPGIVPQARIFWDSRALWSCRGDKVPVFSEYPPTS